MRGQSPHLYGLLRATTGLDLRADSPDWGELSALAEAESFIGDRFALGLTASTFALRYTGPTRYLAWAGMLQPFAWVALGRVGVMGQVRGWAGRTSVLERLGGPLGGRGEVESDLELLEGSFDLWFAMGAATAGLGVDLSEDVNGVGHTTARAWASTSASDRLRLSGSLHARSGAGETETGFLGLASFQVDRTVELEATLSRTLPDLLLGSEPTVSAALTVRLRLGSDSERPAVAAGGERRTAEILEDAREERAGRRLVRFQVAATADSVAIVGDFTAWEAVPMRSGSGSQWVAERALEPGVYRYAFLVDGTWYVPDGARGVTDDGFGQKNLVLVVPAE